MLNFRVSFCIVLFSFLGLAHVTAAIEKKPVVFVRGIEMSELAETLTYPARIEPRIRAAVVAEADGVVTRIIAPLGTVVKAHNPIFVIRNTDPVYKYSPMIVTSSVSGIVSQVDVTEGSRVSRGDKVALVTDPDQLRVVVEVTAQDLGAIRSGNIATMNVPGAVGDTTLMLKVKGISPFVDPATGTASCELEMVHMKGKLVRVLPPAGVIARVAFRTNVHSGISIPESALTYRGKDPFVRLVTGGKAKYVAVQLGRKFGDTVEILKGLKKGDQVIERTSGFIADGDDVEVQAKDPKDPPKDATSAQTTQG